MKKTIVAIIIILVIIGGGYYFLAKGKSQPDVVPTNTNTNQKPGLRVVDDNSLYGWLSRGKSVVCALTSNQSSLTIYAKNNKIRMEGIPYTFSTQTAGNNGVSLTDGDWYYIWADKQGTKMNLKTLQAAMSPEQKAKATEYSWQDSSKKWENEYQYNCQEKLLTDNLFIPPADIQFNDMTDTLKDLQQVGQDLQQKAGSGTVNQEDIEAQLEQLNKTIPTDNSTSNELTE